MSLFGGSSRFLGRALLAAAVFTTTLVASTPQPAAAHAGDDCVLFSPADVAENDWFGSSVGVDGDTAVITSWIAEEDNGPVNAGAAYVYDRQPDGSWVEGQKLLPSNPGPAFNFGFSADIEGDIIAIGAWHETVNGQGKAGAVYIYERPTPTGTWSETARLVASDADAEDDFGYNLEVDAGTSSVIIGAQQEDEGGSNSGAAYVFRKTNGTWAQEAKLLDPNAGINDRQGNDVAIFGDWAVVGHHLDDVGINGPQTNAGGALLYQRTGTTWGAPIELDGSNPEPVKNRAGYGVDIDGDILVMTSYHDFDDRTPQAWIFRENNGVWTEEQQIFPYPSVNSGDHPDAGPNNSDGTHFGRHVEVDNGVIAIGSSYDSSLDFERGATHYWTQDTNGLWVETARIDPEGNAKYFHAGIAVALSDTHAVIGAEKGNTNDDGVHEPFKTSEDEIFNSGLACIADLTDILDGTHSPNPFYGVYASIGDAIVAEGPAGNTNQASVTVTLSQAATAAVTVDVSTADGSASTSDNDYTPLVDQTVTFNPGSTSETVLVDIIGDFNSEADETFSVEISDTTTGVLVEDGEGQVTITDEDVLTVSVADASVVEGDSGTATVLVDVSLPFPTTATVTADLATSDGTASVADNDYVAYADTVTFNPGDQTKQVSLDVVGDNFIESDEAFTLNVTATSAGLAVLDGTGVITITNDDANTVSVGDTSVTEGPAGSDATATVDVTLSEPAATAVDVTVSSSDGTALLSDGDYEASSQVVSFAVGETTKSVSFTVTGDDTPEPDEVFTVVVSDPTGGVTIGDGSGDVTIVNDDSVSVSIGDASTLEGALGATTAVSVDVTLSSPATTAVSVTVDTADGTATTADSDYTAVVGQVVNFAVGEQEKTVTVDVIGDDTAEPNEALTLVASAPSPGLTIADGTGDIDIFDDDALAVVVGDATVTEGADSTTTTVTVTVSLTEPAPGPVDVTIATADGTATTADSDYVSSSQVVSFLAAESSKTVTFTVNGDDVAEADEVFLVQASGPTGGAVIADGTGEVTIVNDDSVSVSIADGSQAEGDAGSAPIVVDLTLSAVSADPVSVEVSTADGSATVGDSDYAAVSGQTVTFAPGQTSKQISISILGDEQYETDETFDVTLANPSAGLTIADGTAVVTITNDEVISLSVSDASVVEGAPAGTVTASVDLTLSDPADAVMTVLVDTVDGTATAGSDYVAPGQQTVTFQVGEDTKTLDFTVNGDDLPEVNETFTVVASAPTGGLVLGDDTGVVTIINDDVAGPVTVTIGDFTVVEGNAGLTPADVTISLSSPAVVPITLDVSTAEESPVSATDGVDYQTITNQQVSFAVGEQTKTVTVNVIGDTDSEVLSETFLLVGSNLLGSGASFADDTGQITITDDEVVTVSIDDVSVTETDSGAKNVLISFELNIPTFQTVVVQYATQDGTATVADVDYVAKTGEVRFSPGDTVLTRGFQYIGDTNIEDDEFFEVVLSEPVNAVLGQSVASVTILDDDTPAPILTISDASVTEGDSPDTATATLNLSLDQPATEDISFTLTTADGTAQAGADYIGFITTASMVLGQQATTVQATINGDELGELDETFTVTASSPVGDVDVSTAVGTVTIIDDDAAVTASVADVSITEGDWDSEGNVVATNVSVSVNLSFPAPGPMSLDLVTADGTAESSTANPDYVSAGVQTVNFVAGESTKTVVFQVNGDDIAEPDETFLVVASNPTGGLLIADDTGEVTITNDDIVEVSVTGIAVSEGNAGSKNAIATFSLSKPSSVGVRVDYTTTDGTATIADNDYVTRVGDVRFPPLATTRTRGFTVLGDEALEDDEIFTVNLSNPTNAILGTTVGEITILDDDNPSNPLIVEDATVVEGDAGPTTVDVTLRLQDPAADAFTVDVETLNGTAFSGTDYAAINPAQTVAFAVGDETQTVTLTVNGDSTPEADETFALVASNSTNPGVDFADNIGTITIENDDLIDVSIGDATVTEGADATTTDAVVTVSLSQPAIGAMSVDVATLDGSATTGDGDYVALSQTVSFADGEQTKDVTITVNGDDQFEADESFSLVAGLTSGDLNVLDGAGEIFITDDDAAGALSVVIGGANVSEPDTGSSVNAVVDVMLSAPATEVVTVDVASADGTATVAEGDYTAISDTVTFQIGEQTQQVTVQVDGDDLAESDENFTLVLSNPSAGLTIADAVGEITILDNDAAPAVDLTVGDVSVTEGDVGSTATASVVINLAQPPIFPVSVEVSTVDGSATVADNDYIPISSQTVSFGAGQQSKTITIDVVGDDDNELDETFTIVASNPVGAINLLDDTGEITIITDDAILISVGDVTLTETNAGYKWAQVPFTLTAAPANVAETVTVDFTSVDGTATLADNDYEAKSGELRFGNGVSSLTRGFKVFGDTAAEANEVFTVELSNAVNALIDDGIGEITVLDNDTAIIGLTITDVTIPEGDTGTSLASVTVELDSPAVSPLTVDVATADGTATTADSDYVAVPATQLTFNANEQTKTVDITINGDTTVEADETFTLIASNPSNGLELLDGTGVITIVHDDQPRLSLSDTSVNEGDAGTITATVIASLDRSPTSEMTVLIETEDGSATVADGDYTAIGETVTFAPGETSKAINVFVNGDTSPEIDEEFSVVATNPAGGMAIDDDTGTVTITDDDSGGSFAIIVSDASLDEGDAGTTTATVDVSLTFAAPGPVTVDVVSADGSATVADGDYVALPAQTISFAQGEQTKQLSLTINGDGDFEPDEQFTIVASNPTGGATIADGTGVVSIFNDDEDPGLAVSVGDVQVVEGEVGTVIASVPLTLNQVPVNQVSVQVSTVDDTATVADSDYQAFGGTVTFAPGVTSQTVDITINGDTVQELDESFNLVASNPSQNLSLLDDTGVITILSDDGVTISASDVTLTETNAGYRWAQVAFTLSAPPGSNTFTVDYATADGTATLANGDYEARSGQLRFANNRTVLNRGFKVFGDQAVELDETFSVLLSNPVNGSIADGEAVITIVDDDNTGIGLTVGDVTVTEGSGGLNTIASVPLSLEIPALAPVTVSFTSADGTATAADGDFTPVNQQVTFAPGEQFKNLDVTVTGDDDIEQTEAFTVVASNPSPGLILDDDTGEITVTNDDFPAQTAVLTVGDISIPEGAAGTSIVSVPLTLSPAPAVPVSVTVETADGTATDGVDYVGLAAQTLNFAAGQTSETVDIVINGDTDPEVDETFTVEASNPSVGLAIADGTGEVTIATDDAVSISAGDVTMTEIDAGYRWAQVTFTLSQAPGSNTFVVQYSTADGTATLADGDYEAKTGELRFSNSRTTLTRGFKVFGDTTPEFDESFFVNLSNPVNGVIADGQAEITVLDDDNTDIGLTVGDVAVTEGDTGTSTATVDLTLASAAVVPLSVDVATADGSATVADGDYSAVSQQVSFAVGETTKQVSVDVTGDTTIETDEVFTLVASNPSAGMALTDDTGEITITNDDAPPTIDVTMVDTTVAEGDVGQTTTASVQIDLSQNAVIPVSVEVSTVDGSATEADADFTAIAGQTVVFQAGESSQIVDIDIVGDDDYELDEVFQLAISNPSASLNVVDGDADITITNDDALPTLSVLVADATVVEGDAGTSQVLVDVNLSSPAVETVTVDVATADGSATVADNDYTAVSQTLTFNPGDSVQQVSIPVVGDTTLEPDETFDLVASNPSIGLAILDGTGTITITNDEVLIVNVGDTTVTEGDSPDTVIATVGLALSEPAASEVTVVVDTVDGTAVAADGDYVSVAAQIVTFPIGSSNQSVQITVNGDDLIEADETFSVVASSPSPGLSLGDAVGVVTIATDDQPQVFIDDVTLTELNGGYKWAQVRFSLSEPSTQTVQIEFTTVDGTATAAGGDYNPRSEVLSFAPGKTQLFRGIQILGDNDVEADETLTVELIGPVVNGVVGDGVGLITILDND